MGDSLGMLPSTRVNSAWPSFRGWAQSYHRKAGKAYWRGTHRRSGVRARRPVMEMSTPPTVLRGYDTLYL